jgi:hypothetical protein
VDLTLSFYDVINRPHTHRPLVDNTDQYARVMVSLITLKNAFPQMPVHFVKVGGA